MEFIYHANLDSDPDGGFNVTFPDVPEAITAGDDEQEALANAQDALGLSLRCRIKDNEELPVPNYKNGVSVTTDAWDTLKLSVMLCFKQSGMSKTELAARLGKNESEARRILDPLHFTKLQTLEQALRAMNKSVIVIVQDAVKQVA